jgi:hypothetical protein
MADHSADLVAEAAPLLPVLPPRNIQGTGGQLPPLGNKFTDQELENYLKKLIECVKEIGQGASEEEVYGSLYLPDYLTINARSSDTGNCAFLVTAK